jgi:hypothetical protein
MELGDYKVSQVIKNQVEKIQKLWMSQQKRLPDRLTPDCDIALGYYLLAAARDGPSTDFLYQAGVL